VLPALLVVLAGALCQAAYPPNDDATWLMSVARRLAEGGTLYSADIVEINPPLIIWMTSLAVRAGDLVGIPAVVAWRLLVAVVMLVSLWLSARCIAASGGADARTRAVLLAVIAATFAYLPGYQAGQREHFIILWFTPYVLATAAMLGGASLPGWIRVGVGILVGLAVALKPHYAIPLALVEASAVAFQRSLRPLVRGTLIAALAVGIAYLGVVAIGYPGYLSLAVPLALRYYPAYSALQTQPWHLVYLGAVAVGVVATREPRVAVLRCRLFAVAAAGAYTAFLLQDRGWPYHFLPAKAFIVASVGVAAATLLFRILGARRERPMRPLTAAIPSIVVVVVTAGLIWYQARAFEQTRQARIIRNVAQYLKGVDFGEAGGERRLAALSLTLFPAFPVNEMIHARWSSRFSCLWMLPGIIDAEAKAGDGGPVDDSLGRGYLEGAVCDDFDRWRPDVVLVEESRQVSVLDQLLKSPRFRRIWGDYQLVGRVEYFLVFQRAPGAASSGDVTGDCSRDDRLASR
jgi:uncharacterized membrane protein